MTSGGISEKSTATGWLAYPPLSGIDYSPDVGVDYYIWSLQISGLGTTLTGIAAGTMRPPLKSLNKDEKRQVDQVIAVLKTTIADIKAGN